MLTDKCEEDFLIWYQKEFENRNLPYINGFEISDLSIKYGVYVEFFDSVGIIIDVQPFLYYNENVYTSVQFYMASVYFLNVKPEEDDEYSDEFKTRKEAQEQAIIKADKIFNNLNN